MENGEVENDNKISFLIHPIGENGKYLKNLVKYFKKQVVKGYVQYNTT